MYYRITNPYIQKPADCKSAGTGKYKNEDNVKLKGWGVGLFILFAFLCYIASLLIFRMVR